MLQALLRLVSKVFFFRFLYPMAPGKAAEDPIVKLELNYGKVGRIAVDMRLPE